MDVDKPPSRRHEPEGCLVVAIRLPVRIVVLLLVVPVRMVWDALVVSGRFLRDTVLRPVARVLIVWPLVGLWRYVVVPLAKGIAWLGEVLVVVPLKWLYRYVLTPLGHALAWLYARVLTPVGHAVLWVLAPVGRAILFVLYWTARVLLVLPALALWRWVLVPVGRVLAVVGREVWQALGHAWRVASRISLAVGRALATLFRWIFVEPLRWVYRTVLTPVGHVLRDAVVRPVASLARGVGRATREALSAAAESVDAMMLPDPSCRAMAALVRPIWS